MKRKASRPPQEPRSKKQRLEKSHNARLKEPEFVQDEAESYRLTTAIFRVDALSPVWSNGVNRLLNKAHVRRLCRRFSEVGVLRKDASHRLVLLATKDEVKGMVEHLRKQPAPNAERGFGTDAQERNSQWPSFQDWEQVVGRKAELLAGHHRVEALRLHLSQTKVSQDEAWWVCDIYDKGALLLTLISWFTNPGARRTAAPYPGQASSQSRRHDSS